MHDKNGREIFVGDVVKFTITGDKRDVGKVIGRMPASGTCNIAVARFDIAPVSPGQVAPGVGLIFDRPHDSAGPAAMAYLTWQWATASESEKIDP